ncbi:hypothetical protein GWK47_037372 [Chionoecetes opilio]|uniref:Uncharacterized protein n=1 Tax=Chionoecetes opilio TaxID=41210 RepID=A0A8J5CZA7_CHIOP|nr:hypothetical protein GWK47_037372 [Chionoecetes opilio]
MLVSSPAQPKSPANVYTTTCVSLLIDLHQPHAHCHVAGRIRREYSHQRSRDAAAAEKIVHVDVPQDWAPAQSLWGLMLPTGKGDSEACTLRIPGGFFPAGSPSGAGRRSPWMHFALSFSSRPPGPYTPVSKAPDVKGHHAVSWLSSRVVLPVRVRSISSQRWTVQRLNHACRDVAEVLGPLSAVWPSAGKVHNPQGI